MSTFGSKAEAPVKPIDVAFAPKPAFERSAAGRRSELAALRPTLARKPVNQLAPQP
jgi:hypothetical protein